MAAGIDAGDEGMISGLDRYTEELRDVRRQHVREQLELDGAFSEVDQPDAVRSRLDLRIRLEQPANAVEDASQLIDAREAGTRRYNYRVDTNLGRGEPTQFTLNEQLQVQLGMRYGF